MKIIVIWLCIMLLISCTSKPLSVKYYLLHTPENRVSKTTGTAQPIAVLESLIVADYLRQSSLVMQVNQYELHYSRQDVWAEKLQSSLHKALLQDLNSANQQNYVASSSSNAHLAGTTITIKLDHFHATDASTVVSSGQYWLSADSRQLSKNKDLAMSNHLFFFELELKQDGYAHAVKQLRKLVAHLAKKIEKDIAALPRN